MRLFYLPVWLVVDLGLLGLLLVQALVILPDNKIAQEIPVSCKCL